MEVERIFSADQIEVHPELARTIKDYTKAVIKAKMVSLATKKMARMLPNRPNPLTLLQC